MAAGKNRMFRSEALEQHNSPEQLEQLLKVTDRKAWISLGAIGGLVISAVVWSLIGQIPMTVAGVGILIYPRQVVSFQALSQGQVAELQVTVGTRVEQGDVIAVIRQPSLEEELKAERNRLDELTRRNTVVTDLTGQRGELQKEALERQRTLLQQRITSTTQAAERQYESSIGFIDVQKQNAEEVIRTQRAMEANLRERYETFVQLQKEGLSSNEIVLNARQQLIDQQVRASELKLKLQELELSRNEAVKTREQQLQEVAEMESRLQELSIEENQAEQQGLESQSDREMQIQSARNRIQQIETDLGGRGRIVAQQDGRILELAVRAGQFVSTGQRLGSLQIENEESELVALAYLSVGDGKNVKPGMDIRITPSTVERERFGSMEAKVTRVASFPVTADAAATLIGSRDVAEELMQNSSKIQVTTELLLDPESTSGFRWTSGVGPPDAITSGTTAQVQAVVEYRRPITFVIPILRRWTGV